MRFSRTTRQVVAAGVAIVLLSLLVLWQQRRMDAIQDCMETGGLWDGPRAHCHYPDGRMLIRPDLRRG